MAEQPEDEEAWAPPLWPRYFGVVWLALCIVGFTALALLALREVSTPDGVNAEAVMGVIIGIGGTYYVVPQLRNALTRLREAKEQQ